MINTGSFLQKAIEEQIFGGGLVTLHVTGRSMRPFLSGTGKESVVVSRHEPNELKPGIIIVFLYHNKHVFHRIINKMNDRLIVQGDGNCVETESVELENVLGVVRYIIKNGNRKINPYGFSSRIYWRMWYILRPVRKYLLLLYNQYHK